MQGLANVYEYAPIAKALHTLDDAAASRTKRKFDIAYLIAKENMSFAKMAPLCHLEERHGVDLGHGYKNELACATFIDYIAQEQRQGLAVGLRRLCQHNFRHNRTAIAYSIMPVSQDILTLGYFVAAAKYPRILCCSK